MSDNSSSRTACKPSPIVKLSSKHLVGFFAAWMTLAAVSCYNTYSYWRNAVKIRTLLIIPAKESAALTEKIWEIATKAEQVRHVVVTTDDVKIAKRCRRFGADVMMTSKSCKNGMERCIEVLSKLKEKYNIIINVEWDELLISKLIITDIVRTHQTAHNFEGVICMNFKMLADGGYEMKAINVDNSGSPKQFIILPE